MRFPRLAALIASLAAGAGAGATTHNVATYAELVTANGAYANGDTIVLAAGSYTATQSLTWSKNVTIRSAGAVTIDLAGTYQFIVTGQSGGTTQTWDGSVGGLTIYNSGGAGTAASRAPFYVRGDTASGAITLTMRSMTWWSGNSTYKSWYGDSGNAGNYPVTVTMEGVTVGGPSAGSCDDAVALHRGGAGTGANTLYFRASRTRNHNGQGVTGHNGSNIYILDRSWVSGGVGSPAVESANAGVQNIHIYDSTIDNSTNSTAGTAGCVEVSASGGTSNLWADRVWFRNSTAVSAIRLGSTGNAWITNSRITQTGTQNASGGSTDENLVFTNVGPLLIANCIIDGSGATWSTAGASFVRAHGAGRLDLVNSLIIGPAALEVSIHGVYYAATTSVGVVAFSTFANYQSSGAGRFVGVRLANGAGVVAIYRNSFDGWTYAGGATQVQILCADTDDYRLSPLEGWNTFGPVAPGGVHVSGDAGAEAAQSWDTLSATALGFVNAAAQDLRPAPDSNALRTCGWRPVERDVWWK